MKEKDYMDGKVTLCDYLDYLTADKYDAKIFIEDIDLGRSVYQTPKIEL